MKFATAAKGVVAVGLGFLSSQANFGVEAMCPYEIVDDWQDDCPVYSRGYSGTIQPSNGRRKLQDNAPLKGKMVMGTDGEMIFLLQLMQQTFHRALPAGLYNCSTLRLSGVYHRGLWQGPEIPA